MIENYEILMDKISQSIFYSFYSIIMSEMKVNKSMNHSQILIFLIEFSSTAQKF